VSSLDPARHWLAAGITGLARGREWDAVATVAGAGTPGDEAGFVVLPDGRLLAEGGAGVDAHAMAGALAGAIDPPYRAVAVRQEEVWAVGAVAIDVVELQDDPGGDAVEIVRTEEGLSTRIDDVPSTRPLPELERLGEARGSSYVVRAARLEGSLFQLEVEAL
jgi:hypothetical protein